MEIVLDPEIYSPVICDDGSYMDMCPAFIKNGIRCPCGSRTEHVYDSKTKFKQHIISIKHKKWIEILNREKQNHYKENIELTDNNKHQREIIATLQKEIIRLQILTQYLESRISFSTKESIHIVDNLLDLDM